MATNTLQENKMGVMPVGKLLANMATPIIISMLVTAMYNIIDSIYVAQVSESAVTALSLAFPINNLQIAAALGIGIGVNAHVSKSLGEGNQKAVDQAAGNGVFLVLAAAALFALFGIFGVRPYYMTQSHVQETVEGGIAYTRICCIFSLGIFIEILGERLLQSSGRTIYTLVSQGLGSIINIVLDPIFIHGFLGIPAMGVAGAAIATVIGQWSGALLTVFLNVRFNSEVHFSVSHLCPRKESMFPILAVGLPAFVMNGIGSIMTFGINQILQSFQETATSVMGVYFRLQSFFFMPLFGVNNATISIAAYNYGAKKPGRIVKTLKITFGIGLAVMLLGLVCFQLMPQFFLGMFNPSDSFLEMGCKALRIISLSFPMAAVGVMLGASFQALGNGTDSAIVSISRQLLVLLPAAYLLSLSGNVNLVWWAFPIAEVVSAAVTLILFRRLYVKKIKPLF